LGAALDPGRGAIRPLSAIHAESTRNATPISPPRPQSTRRIGPRLFFASTSRWRSSVSSAKNRLPAGGVTEGLASTDSKSQLFFGGNSGPGVAVERGDGMGVPAPVTGIPGGSSPSRSRSTKETAASTSADDEFSVSEALNGAISGRSASGAAIGSGTPSGPGAGADSGRSPAPKIRSSVHSEASLPGGVSTLPAAPMARTSSISRRQPSQRDRCSSRRARSACSRPPDAYGSIICFASAQSMRI